MIRKAKYNDTPYLIELLRQVNNVHAIERPDIFIYNKVKYTENELSDIITNDSLQIFVYEENGEVLGYIFCIIRDTNHNNLVNRKVLYIDDLCVDEKHRGRGIGSSLFTYVKEFAAKNDFNSIELNVWELNCNAKKFYKSIGLEPLKTTLEMKI